MDSYNSSAFPGKITAPIKRHIPPHTSQSALGTITNNSGADNHAAFKPIGYPKNTLFSPETGEIIQPDYSQDAALITRYALLSAAKDRLATKGGKRHRTCNCLSMVKPDADEVLVKKSLEHGTTNYKNLTVCGSVWSCPICGATISEHRAREIREVIEAVKAKGGRIALVTFTIPHGRRDNLSSMVKLTAEAFDRTWKSEPAKRLKNEIGMEGYVRSREVTYGHANGWHPHFHQLVIYFCDSHESAVLKKIKSRLYPIWANRCEKLGLGTPSYKRGLDVRNGMNASEYVAKFEKEHVWGLDKELTKGHLKKGTAERYQPFDLLREWMETGNKHMSALFLEYVDAFHGAKFITWSQGLKDEYDINDSIEKDRAIAENTDDLSITIGRISLEDWKKILFHKQEANVLIFARENWAIAEEHINSLPRPYRKNTDRNDPKAVASRRGAPPIGE